jgi:protein SCO1/2
MNARLIQRVLWIVLAGLLAAMAVVLIEGRGGGGGASPVATAESKFDGPLLPAGLRAADFILTDQNGRRVTLSRYRGRVVVLTFIHSQCHDACPLMVQQIKGALNELTPGGAGVPALGVTVAPAEDTVASRQAFVARMRMGRQLAFLSGPAPALKRVWRAYAIQPVASKIDHSTFVLLVDKRGYERIGYPVSALTPEGLAHDIAVLQREPA